MPLVATSAPDAPARAWGDREKGVQDVHCGTVRAQAGERNYPCQRTGKHVGVRSHSYCESNRHTGTQLKLETEKFAVFYPDHWQKVSVHCE